MTLQMEPGTQRPLRPAVATLSLDSAFTVVQDAAPVTWTANGLRIGHGGLLNLREKFMDDDMKITMNSTDTAVVLQDGLYEVRVEIQVVNSATAVDFTVAVTNLAGSVIHFLSDLVEGAASADTLYSATCLVSIAAGGVVEGVAIRIASEGVSSLSVAAAHIGSITRIGNAGEAGPA